MSEDIKKLYDVAISFLAEDIHLASAINEQLRQGLETFFFPRNQEELAGTNGLESMRQPFLLESRLNLVLYREKWGMTPWTGVESIAIQESCLANHFENVFFFMLNPADRVPKWLPKTHVRFNYGDFTLDQAVGAIKARVQDLGGKFRPLTPVRRAEMFEAEQAYLMEKKSISHSDIQTCLEDLFRRIEDICTDINSSRQSQIRLSYSINAGSAEQSLVFSNESSGCIVSWYKPYSNSFDRAALTWGRYNQRLLVGEELKTHFYLEPPKPVKTTRFVPELSRAREMGWTKAGTETFISNAALAEQTLFGFFDTATEKARKGAERY